MDEGEKQDFLDRLDDELHLGGVMLSQWSAFLIRDADMAFVAGANLAVILTAIAGIESHLRYEHGSDRRDRLARLIDTAEFPEALRVEIHELRRYRNMWVHVSDPHDDEDLIENSEIYDEELEAMATRAIRALRQVIYANQWT